MAAALRRLAVRAPISVFFLLVFQFCWSLPCVSVIEFEKQCEPLRFVVSCLRLLLRRQAAPNKGGLTTTGLAVLCLRPGATACWAHHRTEALRMSPPGSLELLGDRTGPWREWRSAAGEVT
eukprot:scaffold50505_cov31-Prasinocladus_malaysianus.AAC.1